MPRWWLAVGQPKQWLEAFEQENIWGLKNDGRPALMWELIAENDKVLFYATTPIAGIIGHGTVRKKFRQDKPLWTQEIEQNSVLWPLRFEFDIERTVPFEQWKESALADQRVRTLARGGFQSIDPSLAEELMLSFTGQAITTGPSSQPQPSLHNRLKEQLVEAGIMQRYFAEQEYKMENERLDVVWRRVANSVPTFVFEVQIGGDIYHALGKLKHAYDLWNSRIFIVAQEKQRQSINALLSGTFHEIRSAIRFLEVEQLQRLYDLKKQLRDLEHGLGLL